MVTLFTDSDCDLTLKEANAYGYRMISMPYTLMGETVFPYEDGRDVDFHDFYEELRRGNLPNTGSISKDKYIGYFEPELQKGNDILYVHFSRAMTQTFDNMDLAVRELKEKYPERTITDIDTKGITILSYAIVREIGDMFLKGKTVEEIVAWANDEVSKFAIYFFADDLKFFRHSGRVSGLAATMGGMIGIRPVIYIGDDGKMTNIGKTRGRANAIQTLLDKVDELGDDVQNHRIIVGNTDAPEIVEILVTKLKEKYPLAEIVKVDVNPTTGGHCGPNGVGVCFHAKHR